MTANVTCRRCHVGVGPLCRKCIDRAHLALGRSAPGRRFDDRVPPRRRPDWIDTTNTNTNTEDPK